MPSTTRRDEQRQLDNLVGKPQRVVRDIATGQQGGFSGQIPGTSSDPTQVAIQNSTIHQYPGSTTLSASVAAGASTITTATSIASGSYISVDTGTLQESNTTTGVSGSGPYTITLTSPLEYAHASGAVIGAPTTSPNGDQVAGVGHSVLNNSGNPVAVWGNLNAVSGGSGSNLPSSFQDGGFMFTDANGNAVAGYSHPTGLFGFGGAGPTVNTYAIGAFKGPMWEGGATGSVVLGGDNALDLRYVTDQLTFSTNTGTPIGSRIIGATAERTGVYWDNQLGKIPAGTLISVAALCIGPTLPNKTSMFVQAAAFDKSVGYWAGATVTNTSTWVSTSTESVEGLQLDVPGQPVALVARTPLSFNSQGRTAWGPMNTINSGDASAPAGDGASAYIQFTADILAPIWLTVRTSAWWAV